MRLLSGATEEYRLGHFAAAIDWAQKPLQTKSSGAYGPAYAVLAMAHWQLGEKDDARALLAKGNVLDPRELPVRVIEDSGNAWLAWLFARVELDEAELLIQPGLTPTDTSKKPE